METVILLEPSDVTPHASIAAKLADVAGGRVVIDLSRVPYVTSSSLTELIRLRNRLPDASIVLRGARGLTLRVLRVVSFDRVFEIEPS